MLTQTYIFTEDFSIVCSHAFILQQACEHVLRVVSYLPVSTEPPIPLPKIVTEGRQVQLLPCKESGIFPYCVQLLITSFMASCFCHILYMKGHHYFYELCLTEMLRNLFKLARRTVSVVSRLSFY